MPNSTTAVDTLFEDFMEWRLKDSPEFSTCFGIHTYDSALEHYSKESYETRKSILQTFLKRSEDLVKHVEGDTLKNLKLFQFDLNTVIQGYKYYRYAAPLNYFEGPQSEILQLVSYMEKNTVEDFEKIISRYQEFPRQAGEMIDMMQLSIEDGTTSHESSMLGLLDQLKALQVPVEKSEFYETFQNIPVDIPKDVQNKIQIKAKAAISDSLLPAFARLEKYIRESYIAACRKDIAATSLPDGINYYKSCLNFHLSCDMTPEQVHQLGLQEVARISNEMKKIISNLKLNLTIQEFSEKLRNDSQFSYTDKEVMLQDYRNIVNNDIMPTLLKVFKALPKAELNIKALPGAQSGGPQAFYLAGSINGKRPGAFYVNAENLKTSKKYEMMTLALHEALPGHHLQNSFMIELPGVPRFRQVIEDRRYFSAPARFPIHTAYSEGWGLYCEYLGEELNLFKDPYYLFGRLSFEIFRAGRLVVDTGIHAFGWSRERAVDYLYEHTAITKETVEKEINRYIMWPGQACGYKIGEIKIKNLRKRVEEELGEKFSIKEFHELVLHSMGPLSFLEEQVDEFLKRKKLIDVV